MTDTTTKSPRPKLVGRLLLIIIGLCLPLFALEIGVRLVGLAPPPQPNPSIWDTHPLFGWWHVPNRGGVFHSDFNEFAAEVQINARGLRDREIGYDNPSGALRVLSLADSFGEALQVDLEETYHKHLERNLSEQLGRPVEVINAGVGGWGTDQEAIFYVAEGFRYEPDVVLLALFVRNDVVNNYGPLEIARNGGRQVKAFFSLSPTGELIQPPPWTEVESAATETVNPEQADKGAKPPLLGLADSLWQWSALYRFMMPHLRDIPPVVHAVGPSGILGGEAVVRANHPTVPIPFFIYQSPPNEEFEAAWQLTEAIILRLRDEVAGRGSQLAVVLVGAPEQLDPTQLEQMMAGQSDLTWDVDAPNQRLTAFLTENDIPHLDLLPHFRTVAADPQTPALHFTHDQHWTPTGHKLAGQALTEFLLDTFGAEWE